MHYFCPKPIDYSILASIVEMRQRYPNLTDTVDRYYTHYTPFGPYTLSYSPCNSYVDTLRFVHSLTLKRYDP